MDLFPPPEIVDLLQNRRYNERLLRRLGDIVSVLFNNGRIYLKLNLRSKHPPTTTFPEDWLKTVTCKICDPRSGTTWAVSLRGILERQGDRLAFDTELLDPTFNTALLSLGTVIYLCTRNGEAQPLPSVLSSLIKAKPA